MARDKAVLPAAGPLKKGKKTGGQEGGELSPEETKNKLMRKHAEEKCKEIANIQTAYATTIANHQTCSERVANDAAWHWGRKRHGP